MGMPMKPGSLAAPVEKVKIATDFGAATATYEMASRLQQRMGAFMIARLPPFEPGRAPLRILDLGCGTGYFTRQLARRYPGAHVTAVDLSGGMIDHARRNSPEGIRWVVSDAEQLPFADGSFDVVFSNLMVQWCEHPDRVFAECRRVLNREGVLQCSTLLEGSLRELAQAWAQADPGHRHVNAFDTAAAVAKQVHHQLPGAGLDTQTIELDYASPLTLGRELKHLGAVYKGADRRNTLTAPGRVRAMCEHYPKRSCGSISASYEACWISYGK